MPPMSHDPFPRAANQVPHVRAQRWCELVRTCLRSAMKELGAPTAHGDFGVRAQPDQVRFRILAITAPTAGTHFSDSFGSSGHGPIVGQRISDNQVHRPANAVPWLSPDDA
jgi:hypothetical protein